MKLLPSNQQAFTLIELMVTAVILVLVLALASINYLRFLEKQRLYDAGNGIEALLKDARNKAKTGFLGSQELGFCTQLQGVEVVSKLNLEGKLTFEAQLLCVDESVEPIIYDQYVVEEVGALLSQSMSAIFFPKGGVLLALDGGQVDELSAVIQQGTATIVVMIDGGGLINVSYE
jgi:prepilin-type N-terminal cleavage/methylation domain-containing protein